MPFLTRKSFIQVSFIILGLISTTLCLKEYLARLMLEKRVALMVQNEEKASIEKELNRIRLPYESILWHRDHANAVASLRGQRAREIGITSIMYYGAVLRDEKDEWQLIDDSEKDDFLYKSFFHDASLEKHFLREYNQGCRSIQMQINGSNDTPLGRAIKNKDKDVLQVIRLHVGRALKSNYEHTIMCSCRLWLALFEPNDDVLTRLGELARDVRKGQYTTPSGNYDDVGRFAIQAVRLNDYYSLPVSYPQEIRQGRAWADSKPYDPQQPSGL